MKTLLLFFFSLSLIAVEPKPFMDQIDAARAERATKAKAARVKLIEGLKREEKAAQSAGKLDLVLTIRSRVAELEAAGSENPFDKTEASSESVAVAGSSSEKTYSIDLDAASVAMGKKLETLFASLETKKTAATKAGKIDEALAYEGIMVEVKSVLDTVKKPVVAKSDDEPVGTKVGGATCYDLSEMKLVSSRVGYSEVGINRSSDGVHLPRIKGVVPKKYLMACAPSALVYKIPSGVQKFETTALRADDSNGTLRMIVKIDGKVVYETKEMAKQSDAEKIMIDVPAGATQIELIADPCGAITNDYASWCEPKFWKK